MREDTFLQRILLKIFKKVGIIKEFEVDNSEMCQREVSSGVCPNACEICAWEMKFTKNEVPNECYC